MNIEFAHRNASKQAEFQSNAVKSAPASIALWLLVVLQVGGCASWSNWPASKDKNTAGRATVLPLKNVARSIELETRFIQIGFDPTEPDQLQSIWQWVDETVIPSPTRQLLQHNGLRIGKATQSDRLNQRLHAMQSSRSGDVVDTFLSSASISSHQNEGNRTNPVRLGKRFELPVRDPIQGDHVVLIYEDPQPIGQTLRDPQFLFAITPQRGGSATEIRLRVRPEIQHGDMQQDWLQGSAALRIDTRRQSWSLDTMEFELVGGEGDVFVVSETAPRKGLGTEMFSGKNVDQMEQQTVLLIRIANVPTPAEKL